jgi:hypothetical protein
MDESGKQYFPQDIITTINKVIENRTYGSIQIYFEDGTITQITQTTIKKVSHPTTSQNSQISKHFTTPKQSPKLPQKL